MQLWQAKDPIQRTLATATKRTAMPMWQVLTRSWLLAVLLRAGIVCLNEHSTSNADRQQVDIACTLSRLQRKIERPLHTSWHDPAALSEGRNANGSRKRKRRQRLQRVEGTTAGDGVRRLCFCPRHRLCAAALQPNALQVASSPTASQLMPGGQQQRAGTLVTLPY
jgi:hypothetical protein